MIQFKEQFITPTIAKQMLVGNTQNRKIRLTIVDKYADDIVNGRWRTNTGEVIKISETGRVLDGQHRLHAVIKSKKGINVHIATGLSDDTFDVIDTGLNRGASDVFHIDGITNATILPSIIQAYTKVKQKSLKLKTNGLTNAMVLSIYQQQPEEWQLVTRKAHTLYSHFLRFYTNQ